MKAISVEHVSKSFGTNHVLKDINLQVKQGEIFTLLGENGAGKSTLINILTTLSTADSGTLSIMGVDVQKSPDKIRELISYNAQSTTLDDEFTGLENLMIIAKLRNLPAPKKTIEALAERLDLQSFLHKKVGKYSGGMRRRVDIAMSLLGNPAVIFLDEPTAGIDPKNRLEIWNIIKELKNSGKTIFLTTQYLEEADQLSDHIGFMNNGRIVLYGTPEEVKNNTQEQVMVQVDANQLDTAASLLKPDYAEEETSENGIKIEKRQLQPAILTLANHHIAIEKVIPVESRLEEIFLSVTSKESK